MQRGLCMPACGAHLVEGVTEYEILPELGSKPRAELLKPNARRNSPRSRSGCPRIRPLTLAVYVLLPSLRLVPARRAVRFLARNCHRLPHLPSGYGTASGATADPTMVDLGVTVFFGAIGCLAAAFGLICGFFLISAALLPVFWLLKQLVAGMESLENRLRLRLAPKSTP